MNSNYSSNRLNTNYSMKGLSVGNKKEEDKYSSSLNSLVRNFTNVKFDNTFTINIDEVRSLNNKIRFLSDDNIKKINENLISELLVLGNTINKVFSYRK